MKLFEVLSFLLIIQLSVEETLVEKRINHKPISILEEKLSTISKASQLDHLKQTVSEILIPRIVGTEGHDKVRDFIIKSLETLEWHIERDIFEDDTPNFGRLKFENIIATLNPNAERFLVLACHYDSKYIPGEVFLGATDSAVPCAMLINLVHVLKTYLDKVKTNTDLSLKLVFFDGEEAFQEWTSTDSIYGARHLATKWNDENFLERIDMLMLLDLIGAPDPKFYSFFQNTVNWYTRLISIEERLATGDNFENYTTMSPTRTKEQRYFQALSADSYIEDDHIPFLRLGVPIMHLIPIPFPDVWHKVGDNHDIIDYTTVENINKVLRVFIIEYLHIEI